MEEIIEETLKEIKKNIGNNIYKSYRFISETKIIQHFNDANTNKCIKSVHFSKTTPIKKLQEMTFTREKENIIKEVIWYEYDKTSNKLIKTTTYDNSNDIFTIDDIKNNTITTETYHSNGKIKERIIKDKNSNKITSIENFNENGICISATAYDTEGQKTFEREFYEDGKTVKCLHTYKNGKRIKSESFDEKNNKIQEDTYYSFDDTKIQKSTTYDPQTKMIIKDVYFDGLGKLDKQVQYTETTTQLDTYNSNGKKTKTEIFDKENNKIEEQTLNNKEQVIQITKFCPNKEKDLEIFFDKDGKIEKVKTYCKNKCNREYTFQNIVNFDRDKFLNLSMVERENQLDQLIETNTKYCTEYNNGKKIKTSLYGKDGKILTEEYYKENETIEKIILYKDGKKAYERNLVSNNTMKYSGEEKEECDYKDIVNSILLMVNYELYDCSSKLFFRTNGSKEKEVVCFKNKTKLEIIYKEDGKTIEKTILYEDNKKDEETYFREDGEAIEKTILYKNNKKDEEIYFRKNGKTIEKMIKYTDGKKVEETYFREDNKTIEKMIFYENDGKTIRGIFFCDANNKPIGIVNGTNLQKRLEDSDTNEFDIETLTMSVDEKDNSIKHYSVCNKTDKNIRHVFTYKNGKKVKTTQIINENDELQNTLSSVQGASEEMTLQNKTHSISNSSD